MPNSALPASTGAMAARACAWTTARILVFSPITLAIAEPAELVNEPEGVVTILTVCAAAGAHNAAAMAEAASSRITIILLGRRSMDSGWCRNRRPHDAGAIPI